MDWRILGPLEVWADGSLINIGGRQRRLVLAILLAEAGHPVSTEKIIDEIWGEDPPESARKTVQAHVAHLRRALNGDREVLGSSRAGYVVAPEPSDIDARRFQESVERARESNSTDPATAVGILDGALDLFRGEPFAGLADDSLSVKIEASRLSELRVAAQEERLEALLEAGEHAFVVADADALLAEHPMRERLWAIQMLALYRAGRQSDALRAYTRARHTLSEELGIEPSTELQTLEQQILEQDPALEQAPRIVSAPGPVAPIRRNPFKGLRAFDEADTADFFGRSELTRQLVDRVTSRPPAHLTVLTGPSGAGKSSVLRAGVVPQLRDQDLAVALMFPGVDPVASLEEAMRRALLEADEGRSRVRVVAVDQFEEVFTLAPEGMADAFLERIADESEDVSWLITIRADFLDRLLSHRRLGLALQESLVLIPPLQDHEVEAVITRPAHRVGIEVEPGLVAAMLGDLHSSSLALPLLQYSLTDLVERRRGDTLTVDAYRRAGGLAGSVTERADQAYDRLNDESKELTKQIFLQLATISETGEVTSRRLSRSSLHGGGDSKLVETILERFGSQRLLSFDQDDDVEQPTVEIAHETLLTAWPRLASWVADAREDLTLRGSLDGALGEWEAQDRDPGFLLSGGRLAQHLAWTADTSLPLSEREREFLEASRRHEAQSSAQRRRRRRWIMAGFATAAVVAAVLGVLAVQRAQEATAESWAASARAVLEEDPELSVLLGIEALQLRPDSAAAKRALNEALQTHRTMFAVDRGLQGATGAISPDGSLLAVTSEFSVLEVYEVGEPKDPLWTVSAEGDNTMGPAFFTQDGSRLLVFEGFSQESPVLVDGEVTIHDAVTGDLEHSMTVSPCLHPAYNASTADGYVDLELPLLMLREDIAADGSGCLVGEVAELVAVDVMTGEETDLTRISPLTDDAGGTVSADGSRYAVGGGWESSGAVYEFGSTDVLVTLDPGLAVLSADGRTVLAGNEPLTLIDVVTGEKLREYPGLYANAKFSPSGQLVIASSFDGSTKVFDTIGGQQLFELRGSTSRTLVAQATADDHRVATFSGDGSARVWDIDSEMFGTGSPVTWDKGQAFFMEGGDTVRGVIVTSNLVIVPARTEAAGATTMVYDEEGDLLKELTGRVMAVTPDGTSAAIEWWPGTTELTEPPGEYQVVEGLHLIDIESGELLTEFEGRCTWYNQWTAEIPGPDCGDYPDMWVDYSISGSMSPGGDFLAIGGTSGYVAVWDVATGELVAFFDSVSGGNTQTGATTVEFSPDGGYLAAHQWNFGSDKLLRKINTVTWEIESEIDDLEQPLNEIEFTPDGTTLVAVDWSSNVVLVDTEAWSISEILEGHQGGVHDVDVSPDGAFAVTATSEGVSWVWDLETGSVANEFYFPATVSANGVINVEFLDDESLLVSSTDLAVVMTLDSETLAAYAKSRVTRSFTEPECVTYGIDPCPVEQDT